MSRECIESIPVEVRSKYPDLVRFAQLYQDIRKGPDEFWDYYIDYVLIENDGKLLSMDRPVRKLMKCTVRTISADDRCKLSMWIALHSVLITELRINLSDYIGCKLFVYIGRYAFQILYQRHVQKQIITAEYIHDAIDQSLFINIFTGWVFLSTPLAGFNRDVWTRFIKNVCWDFARGRTKNKSIGTFVRNSPYFWVRGGNFTEWSQRPVNDKLGALAGIYSGKIKDPFVFSNGPQTLYALLEYHPDTSKIKKSIDKTENLIRGYLEKANPTYTQQ